MAALFGCASAYCGQLSGSFQTVPEGGTVNLTAEGPADWIHWGLDNDRAVNRKAGVGPQIGNFSVLIGEEDVYVGALRYDTVLCGYSWSDGAPTPSVTSSPTGVYLFTSYAPLGSGFEFEVPADARSRTLKVHLGVFSGEGTLVATLSDGSAAPFVTTFSDNNASPTRVYSLTYAANSASQSMRVRWTLTKRQGNVASAPNVNLQAAALITPGISVLPAVEITSVATGDAVAAGTPIPLSVAVSDIDGTVSSVAYFDGDTLVGETTTAPFNLEWSDALPGFHTLTAVATDDAGESAASPPVEIHVHGGSAVLTGSFVPLPSGSGSTAVDLSVEGTRDWVHWGFSGPASLERRSGVAPLIGPWDHLGTEPLQQIFDSSAYWSWSNGTPTAENFYSTTGIQAYGRTNGFELQLDASPEGRRARVYLGLYGSSGVLRAYLANHSAPAYFNQAFTNFGGLTDGYLDIRYASVAPSTSLMVRYESLEQYDLLYGTLRLLSATLQPDDSVFLPLRLIDPHWTNAAFVFSFQTQPNYTYTVQRASLLPASPWDVITNLPGTGQVMTLTNQSPPGVEAYYRVSAQ